jgi:hypothetical protein
MREKYQFNGEAAVTGSGKEKPAKGGLFDYQIKEVTVAG